MAIKCSALQGGLCGRQLKHSARCFMLNEVVSVFSDRSFRKEISIMSEELVLVQDLIHEIRGQKVMLDFDLAKLYQIETKALKQAVRRNLDRFPSDFMFTLSQNEYNSLKISIRSQFVTLESGRGKFQYCNYARFCSCARVSTSGIFYIVRTERTPRQG